MAMDEIAWTELPVSWNSVTGVPPALGTLRMAFRMRSDQ